MENKIYVSGITAIKGFLERLFVVITVGTLFAYVFLRSDLAPHGSPTVQADRVMSTDGEVLNSIAKAQHGSLAAGHN